MKCFKLRPFERVIAWRLALCPVVTTDDLLFALYGGNEPTESESSLRTQVSNLRTKLRQLGIGINPRYGIGYSASDRARLLDVLASEIERNTPPTIKIHRAKGATHDGQRQKAPRDRGAHAAKAVGAPALHAGNGTARGAEAAG